MNNNIPYGTQNNNGWGYQTQPTSQQTRTTELMAVDMVNGDSAAYAYYVAPGMTTFLFDFPNGVLYLKATDGRGIPQPMRIFDIHERVVQQQIPQQSEGQNLNAMQAQIDEMRQMMANLTAAVQSTYTSPANSNPNPVNNQNRNKKGGNNS